MNKALKIIIKALSVLVDLVLTAAIVLLALCAVYTQSLNDSITDEASVSRYSAYKPTESGGGMSFEELRQKNPDIIGWITVDGTDIDYPVVQGGDNIKYVNTSADGTFSLSGSIFLDYRNDPGLGDAVSILYGHNMTGDVMFGGLRHYEDREYFDSHKSGTIFVGGEYFTLRVFACCTANGNDHVIYNPSLSAEEFADWIAAVSEISVNLDNPPENGHVLMLSACRFDETDGRIIVFAEATPGGTMRASEPEEDEPALSIFNIVTFAEGTSVSPWVYIAVAAALAALNGLYLFLKQRGKKQK